MKIMLISETEFVFKNLASYLKHMGHMTDYFPHRQAFSEGFLTTPDLVVVADHRNFRAAEFIRKIRLSGHTSLILALVETPSVESLIDGFDAGADQVTHQEATREKMTSRVLAMLRYSRPSAADRITYCTLMIEPSTMTAKREETVLPLAGKPFALLEFFIRHPDRVHSRERIGESVWDRNLDVFSNVIDVTVSKLRKCVDHDYPLPYIHTVVGRGYMLCDHSPGQETAA